MKCGKCSIIKFSVIGTVHMKATKCTQYTMEAHLAIITLVLLFLNISHFANASIPISENYYPTSCKDLTEDQLKIDIIQIQVDVNKEPFYVKCYNAIESGGWTVVLNRYDGSRSFDCKWKDCVQGFGNVNHEFFIGLEKLHEITSSMLHELMFVMEDFDNTTRIARYNAFAVDNETNSYMIRVLGNYTGDAGDSFSYHAGHKFSTKDRDSSSSCTRERDAPGWFNYCSESNIFGNYVSGKYENKGDVRFYGMCWYLFHGSLYSLKKLTMLIRPVAL